MSKLKYALFGGVIFALLIIFPFSTSAQTVTIDNDLSPGTLGYWSVMVMDGGQSRTAFITARRAFTGDIFTENVLFDYFSYVDIGPQGQAFLLSGTIPTIDVTDPDKVSSSGQFIGANGNTINWTVASAIPNNGKIMTNRIVFRTANGGPLGPLRFYQYLDEDVESVGDDVFFTKGSLIGRNLELFTMDNKEVYGVSQSGVFDIFSGLENTTFAGWAADAFDSMRP
ncbi:MAG: hypothetical protein A3I31_01875 [Candidatus Colwellbacteria bacterium RIFCSPLOWO2_02_FULL_44_20b]|uniref:Uncharacterized protein n=1 Tax=Candidatus Colwellbacteria bacterium RIFCSPLOWO2_02_FULL_44_20b TaxID=1797691 RepID=A0A1G1Z404_9BACT|nr:MAG: hypothetical protein A3I31_01875 [Candidatus Colwellbacteria bacterium RIFCSPLOWO2_02_FULL_44_20b]